MVLYTTNKLVESIKYNSSDIGPDTLLVNYYCPSNTIPLPGWACYTRMHALAYPQQGFTH